MVIPFYSRCSYCRKELSHMVKRIIVVLLVVMLLLSCTSAFAITGDVCPEEAIEFRETGIATFILDNSGRIVGALYPDEKLGTLDFQHSRRHSPTYISFGQTLRRRKFARVELDDSYRITKGGTQLEVTITLTDLEAVEDIIGEDVSVENIIDATIYSPNLTCANVKAAHMFMPQDSLRRLVGTIAFKDGSCLGIYVGHFRDSVQMDLGFRALKTKPKATVCQPCPVIYCPTVCVPTVNVTTQVTTSTTVGCGY